MRNLLPLILMVLGSAALADPPPQPVAPDYPTGHGRIVGGTPAEPGTVPWQVELFMPAKRGKSVPDFVEQHYCGGSLVAHGWVLTAAHCIPAADELAGISVRIGTQDLTAGGKIYAIDRAFLYPNYHETPDNHDHSGDLALIHINRGPADTMASAVVIPLLDATMPPLTDGQKIMLTGWGETQFRRAGARTLTMARDQYSPVLQQATLSVSSSEGCDPQRAAWGIQGMKCAVGEMVNGQQVDSCQGDSGGPYVRWKRDPRGGKDKVLVGVVSFGAGCGVPGRPAFFTPITPAYLDWIRRQMASPSAPVGAV